MERMIIRMDLVKKIEVEDRWENESATRGHSEHDRSLCSHANVVPSPKIRLEDEILLFDWRELIGPATIEGRLDNGRPNWDGTERWSEVR
jgi:hypothetical protein